MDNFDLRKFLAESKQVQEKTSTPQYGAKPLDPFDPRAQDPTYGEGADEAMEELVAEYVTEALKGENADAVYEIIEARCNRAAMEMKMEVVAEILEAYDGRINELEENAVFKEMLDETKMANIKEIRQGLYEMAAELKETYKETYMPEEKVEEGEEAVEEGELKELSYNEKDMVKDFKPGLLKIGPLRIEDGGERVMIPLDVLGYRKNNNERNDGSFSVTLFVKRSDDQKLRGLDRFQIVFYVDKDVTKYAGDYFYPNLDQYTFKPEKIEGKDAVLKYVADNLAKAEK